ncbi:MAG: methyltransferase domain-containing protein [Myxococcota bacterium]
MIRTRLRDLARRSSLALQAFRDAPLSGQPTSSFEPDSSFVPSSETLFDCSEAEEVRWNREWLRYLEREWPQQLRRYTALSGKPALTDDPQGALSLKVGGDPLRIFASKDDLQAKNVMELGCGCGNLGKLLGRYVRTYLGVDYSSIALVVARLVTPENCEFVHVGDRTSLQKHFGAIDTVVSRFFWIHQNARQARRNLEFLGHFVRPEGKLLADFFTKSAGKTHFKVFAATDELSSEYPSAQFHYEVPDIEACLVGSGFELERIDTAAGWERTFATLRKT